MCETIINDYDFYLTDYCHMVEMYGRVLHSLFSAQFFVLILSLELLGHL